MGFEYMGQLPDPEMRRPPATPPFTLRANDTQLAASGATIPSIEDTQKRRLRLIAFNNENQYQEPSYREHVSGPLVGLGLPAITPAHPAHPASPPYQQTWPAPQPPQQAGYPYQAQGQGQSPQQAYPTSGYSPQPQQAGYPYQRQEQPPQAYPAPGYPPQPQPYPGGYNYNGYAQPAQPYAPYAAGYPGNYGYMPYGYPPYGYPPYGWQPARPRRDGYLFGVSITSLVGAILASLTGLVLLVLTAFTLAITTSTTVPGKQQFNGIVFLVALSMAGLAGGGFSLYHSIRAMQKKPSLDFKLPWFWIFFVLYVILVGSVALLHIGIPNILVAILLIALAGILPALTVLALGLRRLHYPQAARWTTSWRRFTLALTSGATSAITIAIIVEFILSAIVGIGLQLANFPLDNPNQPMSGDPRTFLFTFLTVAVIAPFVEEAVKPLAVVVLIGRVRSAMEAFVLGLACGIGFGIIETVLYISQGYTDWVQVAIDRSTACLLHGFGAAMVALGWYYLTHRNSAKNRILLGIGCIAYAVLQHTIWNGTLTVISIAFRNLSDQAGMYLVYSVEGVLSLLMLIFFLFVTGKLRKQNKPSTSSAPRESSSDLPIENNIAMMPQVNAWS